MRVTAIEEYFFIFVFPLAALLFSSVFILLLFLIKYVDEIVYSERLNNRIVSFPRRATLAACPLAKSTTPASSSPSTTGPTLQSSLTR